MLRRAACRGPWPWASSAALVMGLYLGPVAPCQAGQLLEGGVLSWGKQIASSPPDRPNSWQRGPGLSQGSVSKELTVAPSTLEDGICIFIPAEPRDSNCFS